MTFQQRYAALEDEFKAQVQKDNETFLKDSAKKSYYLPNIKPEGPVDFVLVAMEPSGSAEKSDPSKDRKKTVCPRNFSCSVEDFILHFCIREYLCAAGQKYHITDLAKGGMPVKLANNERERRWEKWYPLLTKELALVAEKDPVPVIAIGNGVRRFLNEQKTPNHVGSILHFSKSATKYWKVKPGLQPEQYKKFSKNLRWDDVVQNAERIMKCKEFDKWRSQTLQRLKRGESESRKMLMFTYKCQFAAILGKPLT